ncbi:MAG: ATP-binding protein [Nanoarchaeota archaeon]
MDIKDEKDLNNLIINKISEDTRLEYKRPIFSQKDFKEELIKDISAMANSDGGTIIYGINEDNHFPQEIVWIEKDEGYKEKIEQIANSKIFRKIERLIVKKVLSDDQTKFVIIIEIPKSDLAPHQVHKDNEQRRYYKRQGSITKQMEHYEVEDLFFKRKRPILKIDLRNISKDMHKPIFEIYLENIGKVVGEHSYIKVKIPSEYCIDNWVETKHLYGNSSYERVLKDDFIYPDLKQVIGQIYPPKKIEFGALKINFLLTCKDMELVEGEIYIDCDGNQKVIYEASKTPAYSQNLPDYIFSKNKPFNLEES